MIFEIFVQVLPSTPFSIVYSRSPPPSHGSSLWIKRGHPPLPVSGLAMPGRITKHCPKTLKNHQSRYFFGEKNAPARVFRRRTSNGLVFWGKKNAPARVFRRRTSNGCFGQFFGPQMPKKTQKMLYLVTYVAPARQ